MHIKKVGQRTAAILTCMPSGGSHHLDKLLPRVTSYCIYTWFVSKVYVKWKHFEYVLCCDISIAAMFFFYILPTSQNEIMIFYNVCIKWLRTKTKYLRRILKRICSFYAFNIFWKKKNIIKTRDLICNDIQTKFLIQS